MAGTIVRLPAWATLSVLVAALAVGGLYARSQQTPLAWDAAGQPGWRLADAAGDYATALQSRDAGRLAELNQDGTAAAVPAMLTALGGYPVRQVRIGGQQREPVVVFRIDCSGGRTVEQRVTFGWHAGRLGALDGRWLLDRPAAPEQSCA